MINRDTGSIDQVMKALEELENTIDGAQRVMFSGDRVQVNKAFLMQRFELLGRCLPDAVKQAALIIKEEKAIREAAQKDAAEQSARAREKAQETLDEATRKARETVDAANKEAQEIKAANQKSADDAARESVSAKNAAAAMRAQGETELNAMRQRAQQEADAIRQRAQQEAQMIVANAKESARQAASKEQVYQMATVAAEELRESTRSDMENYRQQCMEYLDGTLADVDRYLVRLSTDIRNQRQMLDSRR